MQEDLLQSEFDFVVLEKLTTPGAGYNSFHHWLCRTISPAKSIPCKFKLSKISRKNYDKNLGLKVDDSHISLTSSSTSKRQRKSSKEDLCNDLRFYYESVFMENILSSQTNLSPDRSFLSKIDTPITITTHAQMISKELNSKSTTLGR